MKNKSQLGGLAIVVIALILAAAAHAGGWGPWSGGGGSSGIVSTLSFTPNGQTLTGATVGEITSNARLRADAGFRIGGVLLDITSNGLSFSASGTPTFDASNATQADFIFKAKSAASATTLTHLFTTGATSLEGLYGGGLEVDFLPQAPAACSVGAITLDPQSAVVNVDAAGAACTATVGVTSVTSIAQETLVVRVTAKNVGAGTLKFASTNFSSALPAKCTTTGLTVGQSALIAWDQSLAKWTFLGGCE